MTMTMTKKIIAVALTGLIAASAALPAQAQTITFGNGGGDRDRVVRSFCEQHPRNSDCRRYRNGNWQDDDYNQFYSRNRSGLDSVASGFFGFTFGAILGNAIANSNNGGQQVTRRNGNYEDHVEACFDRYRSYDEETDSFMGFDGARHRCTL